MLFLLNSWEWTYENKIGINKSFVKLFTCQTQHSACCQRRAISSYQKQIQIYFHSQIYISSDDQPTLPSPSKPSPTQHHTHTLLTHTSNSLPSALNSTTHATHCTPTQFVIPHQISPGQNQIKRGILKAPPANPRTYIYR